MMKTLSNAFLSTRDAFTGAQRREVELVRKVERLRAAVGTAHAVEMRLSQELQYGMSDLVGGEGTEVAAEVLRAIGSRKQARVDQRLRASCSGATRMSKPVPGALC